MTDNEIKKALECCARLDGDDWSICEKECPYKKHCFDEGVNAMQDFLDLINRQQAEIEKLRGNQK